MDTERRNTGDSSASRKIGLSCAECRRSKLKCDRVFPCQSCIRRGCAGICPGGTLAATKGNKVLMAHAQRLAEQVKALTSRVHELEIALVRSHSQDDHDGTHPQPDEAVPETNDELKDVSEAIGSLSIGVDGQAKYHGESAGAEYLQDLLPLSQADWQASEPTQIDLPNEIIDLMHAFPFGLKECPYNKSFLVQYLPTKERALELATLYYSNVAWMYDPIAYQDFDTTILDPIYGTTGYASVDGLHSHRLSVFFIVLANGSLFDSHPCAANQAAQYHALSRAALSVDSILHEATCASVQALFLVFRFIYNSDRTSKEERWLLAGLCSRIAQTIGLQRDSAGWNLPPEEIQRRRRLLWELFTWESWSSLVNGRPASLMIQHTDCQFPEDLYPSSRPSGDFDLGFHAWKFRYSAACLSISVQHVFSTRTPPYSALLEIDKKIRKFPIPSHLRCPARASEAGRSWSSDPSRAMQQYCALCVRESNLLYIHRSYFAQAMRQDTADPLRHNYAPSVLATYKSACRLISSLQGLYPNHPQLSSHAWFFWSAIFSSCFILGALVIESPGCKLSQDALNELESAIPFFEEGSRLSRPPATLTMLRRLYQRATSTYAAFKAGSGNSYHKAPDDPSKPDELQVLGGRKSVITTNSNASSPSNLDDSPTPLYRDGDGEGSPESQFGAAEMLMEYYQELGNPSLQINKGQDYDMAAPAHYDAHLYPSSSKPQNIAVLSTIVAPQPIIDHYIASQAQTTMPSHPNLGFASSTEADQPGGSKPSHTWHPPYPTTQTHPTESSDRIPLTYAHLPPLSAGSNSLGYMMGLGQNQDEIWRNFYLEFEGSV